MEVLALILVGAVAAEHVYILILEMFLWTKPLGLRAFGRTKAEAEASKVLAQNQGLYNGFLAAGLVWGLVHPQEAVGWQLQIFFVSCVIVAAIYGSITAMPKILLVQGLPAMLALTALLLQ